jgi:hypothetical protein
VKFDLTEGEFFKWVGIKLCMAISPRRGGLDFYFSNESDPNSIHEPGNYGEKYGMSITRFKLIAQSLCFHDQNDFNQRDPLRQIRPFVDEFKTQMSTVLQPEELLCIDEGLSLWKGLQDSIAGIFQLSKKKRKLEGVHAEFKSLADISTGCLLKIDLMEEEERSMKKLFNEIGPSVSETIRLTRAYHESGRIVVGDSYFSSFQTADLLSQYGLFFMGVVDHVSERFPKEFLSNRLKDHPNNRGAHTILSTVTENGKKIYALGWVDGEKGKRVISTCATTIATLPIERVKY